MTDLPALTLDVLLIQWIAGAFIVELFLGAAAGAGIAWDVAREKFQREDA